MMVNVKPSSIYLYLYSLQDYYVYERIPCDVTQHLSLLVLQDVDIADMCLRSLKALAAYHYKEVTAGRTGLGGKVAGSTGPDGKTEEGILSRFLGSLLQLLLFDDYRYHIL